MAVTIPYPQVHMKIICAICKKPVEKIALEQFSHTRMLKIKVWCHGDTDTMMVDVHSLDQAVVDQIQNGEGVAFTQKRIEK